MCLILKFLEELHEFLTENRSMVGNIIRKHSKKLDELGDLSFPLNIKNWSQNIHNTRLIEANHTIFDNLFPNKDLNVQIEFLINESKRWTLIIDDFKIKNGSDVHLYLNRPSTIDLCLKNVLTTKNYGLSSKCFESKINIISDCDIKSDISNVTLSDLRILITQKVAENILTYLTGDTENSCDIKITSNSNEKENVLVCGPVLNEFGVKDMKTSANELYKKRALDMQLMAQHKYGIQVKSLPSWSSYFEKLGKASVTLEMLQNKVHKAIKITLSNPQSTNRGPSFIFYNCARMSALFKEFETRVSNKMYPELPSLDQIDFSLLNQPEEWELVYVYVLQFPLIVNSCICDIKNGTINLHYLVSFLSNLSGIFSVYYRRIKILMHAKEHLFPILHARIYLLKAVQQVFHTALLLLDIEPQKIQKLGAVFK